MRDTNFLTATAMWPCARRTVSPAAGSLGSRSKSATTRDAYRSTMKLCSSSNFQVARVGSPYGHFLIKNLRTTMSYTI